MYRLYDEDGILRFINSDKEACLDYADLFQLNSTNFCLIDILETVNKTKDAIPHLNLEENNN